MTHKKKKAKKEWNERNKNMLRGKVCLSSLEGHEGKKEEVVVGNASSWPVVCRACPFVVVMQE